MKLFLSKDARTLDEYAIKRSGVPSIVLMEHAARGVYEEIVKRFDPADKKFVVFYGAGNNGGDAL
ncbi:MAG: NAD(P)H-hydrate epimerase, partial [Pseudomonadota bacterium]